MIEFAPPKPLNGALLQQELADAGFALAEDEIRVRGEEGERSLFINVSEENRSAVQDVIDVHNPPPPPPDPDAELASAITNVRDNAANDDVKALCDALLGNLSQGRAAGRSPVR